jgi:hypothetical protein
VATAKRIPPAGDYRGYGGAHCFAPWRSLDDLWRCPGRRPLEVRDHAVGEWDAARARAVLGMDGRSPHALRSLAGLCRRRARALRHTPGELH